jgi:hypothetical protein
MDELVTGYSIQSSELTKKLESLPASEREKIYDVVETMLRHVK